MQEQTGKMSNTERNAKNRALQYRKSIVLTLEEGEEFDQILSDNDCKNASQFAKKIVSGEISIY